MPTVVEPLNHRLLEGLPEFARQVWDFPDSPDFLRWRIVDPPGSCFFVAHNEGRWLAAIGGHLKTYLNKGEPVNCYETYSWASLQIRESKGWGIKAIRALMDQGKPLVALGGSPDTTNLMPRLGFETMAQAPSLLLPIKPSFFDALPGIKGVLARSAIRIGAILVTPRAKPRAGLQMQPLAKFDAPSLAMPMLPGFQARYTPDLFDWQTGWAEQGSFHALRFVREKQIVGWLYARTAEEQKGHIVGRLLESKFAPSTTAAEHIAMIRSLIAILAGHGAEVVRALTTCPESNAALRACHFRGRTFSPAMINHDGCINRNQPIRVSVLRADGGAQPMRPDALAD